MRRAALLFAFLLPFAAAAHSELRGSEPADGARLAASPAEIVLRFNEPVQVTSMQLTDSAGSGLGLRRDGDTRPSAVERAAPTAPLAPGAYRLVWRAISADGHPIRGTLRFSVAAP